MELKDFATKLVAGNHFIKASFGGFAGSGKTRTASEFVAGSYADLKCKKPVLLIDNEKGSRFLVPFFKKHKIPVLLKETVALADVLQAMEFLKAGEIEYLFIDTLSKVWYQYVRDYKSKKSSRYTFMTLEDWGKILPAWQETFSDKFSECPGNIVFTGRGGFSYEKEEDTTDENGKVKKGQFVKSGVKMKLAGETPFEPDLNLWMELQQDMGPKGELTVWRECQVLKDRSGVIDGKTFKNPTYKDFQPAIQFILDVPTGKVSGQTSDDNLAPSEDFGWLHRKQEREIEIEKIKASWEKVGLGTSKEEKQMRAILKEKVFGSTSDTEIEKMDAEKLRGCRLRLDAVLSKWDAVMPEERLEYVKGFEFPKEPSDDPFASIFPSERQADKGVESM